MTILEKLRKKLAIVSGLRKTNRDQICEDGTNRERRHVGIRSSSEGSKTAEESGHPEVIWCYCYEDGFHIPRLPVYLSRKDS